MSTILRATTPEVPEPAAGTWSNCLVADGVAYVAGMTARAASQSGAAGTNMPRQKRSSARFAISSKRQAAAWPIL